MTFKDGAAILGTGNVNGGQATLTTSLPVGTHSITAAYGGTTAFQASTSPTVTQQVQRAPTSTVVTSLLNPSISERASRSRPRSRMAPTR